MIDWGSEGECWRLKEHAPPILSYPTNRVEGAEHVDGVPWNTNGYRHLAQDSGAILSLSKERNSVVTVHANLGCLSRGSIGRERDQLIERVIATWQLWWSISEGLLRLTLRRRLWGLIGNHLKTIVGRRDSRSTLLRKSLAGLGKSLKAIKAQWERWDLNSRRESTLSYRQDDRSRPGTSDSREEEKT